MSMNINMQEEALTSRTAYTSKELAKEWHTNEHTVNMLRQNGLLHGVRVGRSWLYTPDSIRLFFTTYKDCELGNEADCQRVRRGI